MIQLFQWKLITEVGFKCFWTAKYPWKFQNRTGAEWEDFSSVPSFQAYIFGGMVLCQEATSNTEFCTAVFTGKQLSESTSSLRRVESVKFDFYQSDEWQNPGCAPHCWYNRSRKPRVLSQCGDGGAGGCREISQTGANNTCFSCLCSPKAQLNPNFSL